MGDLDEFLGRQAEAERAMVFGDPEPRMALWSRRDPVSLFGAATGDWKIVHRHGDSAPVDRTPPIEA